MDWFVRNWDLLLQFGFVAYAGLFALLFLLVRLDSACLACRWLMVFAGVECLSRGLFLTSVLLGMPQMLTHAAILVSAGALLALSAVGQYRLMRTHPRTWLVVVVGCGLAVAAAAVAGSPSGWVVALLVVVLAASLGAALAVCNDSEAPGSTPLQPKAAGLLLGLLVFFEALSLAHPWAALHSSLARFEWMPVTAVGLTCGLTVLSALIVVVRFRAVSVRKATLGAKQASRALAWDGLIAFVLAAGLVLSLFMARDAGQYEERLARSNTRSAVSLAAAAFAGVQSPEGTDAALHTSHSPQFPPDRSDPAFVALARQRLEFIVEGSDRYRCAYLITRVKQVPTVVLSHPVVDGRCRLDALQRRISSTVPAQELGTSPSLSFVSGPIWDPSSALTGIALVPGTRGTGSEWWVGLDMSGRRALVRFFGARSIPLAGAGMVCILILFLWAAALLNSAEEAKNRRLEQLRMEERRAAEEAIRASEARFRAMSDSATDAIITMDSNGRVTFWNPAAESIFGYDAHEVMGTPLHGFLASPEQQPRIAAGLCRFHEEGTGPVVGRTQEVIARRKDGTALSVELSLSSMKIGNQWHAVGVARDITKRKQQDAELAASKRELEMANRQLIRIASESKGLAEQASAANVAKSEFLANMSHEFRTPLNGVMGAASLLAETGLSADQRDYVGIVRRSAENLLGILNDILDISKIESGKLELEELDFDPHSLIEDVVELMALRAQEKGLDVSCHTEPYVPDRVRGDPARLRQVLVNLVGNAVKFTPRGEISVRAAAVDVAADGMVLRVDVRDTGIGIPKDKLERLFKPFSQVDTSDTRAYGGTGKVGVRRTTARSGYPCVRRNRAGTLDLQTALGADGGQNRSGQRCGAGLPVPILGAPQGCRRLDPPQGSLEGPLESPSAGSGRSRHQSPGSWCTSGAVGLHPPRGIGAGGGAHLHAGGE